MELAGVLRAYGELAVRIGLNLQPGQRLLIIGPAPTAACRSRRRRSSGKSRRAPIGPARRWSRRCGVTKASSWCASRTRRASRSRSSRAGCPRRWSATSTRGHALISVYANSPDHLRDAPPQVIGELQRAASLALRPFRDRVGRNQTNWSVVAAAGSGWAAKVFPGSAAGSAAAIVCGKPSRECAGSTARIRSRRGNSI